MITVRQIRAARALLDWSQGDLARRAGVSLRALSNIESGHAMPRADTQLYLQQALEKAGVDFLSGDGVRLRSEILEIYKYEGREALNFIFTDIFVQLPQGGDVVGLSLDERAFMESAEDRINEFYKKIEQQQIRERLLIRKGDRFLIADKSHYRWMRRELFTEVPFIVYGDTVLQILWKPSLRLIVIRNELLANAYKKQFEIYWNEQSEAIPD